MYVIQIHPAQARQQFVTIVLKPSILIVRVYVGASDNSKKVDIVQISNVKIEGIGAGTVDVAQFGE